MWKLTSFEDPARVTALDERLSAAAIPTIIRGPEIWLVSEQDITRAQQVLNAFLAQFQPQSEPVPRTTQGSPSAATPKPRAQLGFTERLRADVLAAPVTALLFAASVVVSLYTDLGGNQQRVEQFTIAGPAEFLTLQWNVWGDILSGQVWRLVTPILLHFHPFHLLFNVFWLRDLGVPAERFQGSWHYLLLLLWSAAVSNVAQLVFGQSANFGGLSGVVYALVGYLWARGRADPASGIQVPNSWVIFFLAWLALGFTGILNRFLGGGVANYCHLGGFAAGALYGYIAALLARARARS